MPRARIEVRAAPPDAPLVVAPGATIRVATRVRNLSQRPFAATATYGRRHVRLGAQLASADGTTDRPRLGARLPAARRSRAASAPTSASTCRRRASPGRYALRFDLVSEGIDWFETCGSEPTVRELVVGA